MAITLRNLPEELSNLIRRRARRDGISLNRAVIALLQDALGTRHRSDEPRHHDLDALAGSWSDGEARAFDAELTVQRAIDDGVWR